MCDKKQMYDDVITGKENDCEDLEYLENCQQDNCQPRLWSRMC